MTQRDRKALVIGLAVVSIAWIGLRGVPSVVKRLERLETSAAERAQLLSRAHTRLTALPGLHDSIAVLETIADSLPSMLLSGTGASDSQVDLMAHIRLLLEGRPAGIGAFEQASIDSTAGPLALTGVVVTIESDFQGLMEVAQVIEHHPSLAIDALDVSARDSHSEDEAIEILTARITVSGWYRLGYPAGDSSP